MRTALRKMGNSAGMIVPKAVLSELGSRIGEEFEIGVEAGRIVAAPVRAAVRSGWAEAAALIGAEADAEAEEWLDLDAEADAEWKW
jgi:antitoxin MazE